jgi:hypothetical protein
MSDYERPSGPVEHFTHPGGQVLSVGGKPMPGGGSADYYERRSWDYERAEADRRREEMLDRLREKFARERRHRFEVAFEEWKVERQRHAEELFAKVNPVEEFPTLQQVERWTGRRT